MQHNVLVDYELAVAQQGFIVRALLKLVGESITGLTAAPHAEQMQSASGFRRRDGRC